MHWRGESIRMPCIYVIDVVGPFASSGRLLAGRCKPPLWLQTQGSPGVSAELAKETTIVLVYSARVRYPFSTAIDHAGYRPGHPLSMHGENNFRRGS